MCSTVDTYVKHTHVLIHCIYIYIYIHICPVHIHTHMSLANIFRDEHTCPAVDVHTSTLNLHTCTHLQSNFVYIQTHMSNAPVD